MVISLCFLYCCHFFTPQMSYRTYHPALITQCPLHHTHMVFAMYRTRIFLQGTNIFFQDTHVSTARYAHLFCKVRTCFFARDAHPFCKVLYAHFFLQGTHIFFARCAHPFCEVRTSFLQATHTLFARHAYSFSKYAYCILFGSITLTEARGTKRAHRPPSTPPDPPAQNQGCLSRI